MSTQYTHGSSRIIIQFKMVFNFKKLFFIFSIAVVVIVVVVVIVTIRNSSSSEKGKLLDCLELAGVNSSNIHFRNSGEKYTELNWQWTTLNGQIEPLAYLVATAISDIQYAITCCQLSNIRVVARSGGHSFVKNGFGDYRSLVVDLRKLNEISLHPEQMQCEIGAGARIGYISYTLWEKGNFLLPAGICPTVGIAGLTLGGGYGHYSRLFGLALDNVIGMEMVDATGKLLVINNSTNNDLFWALRGGGGGSFGIVTKFKFKMYTAPESVLFGMYYYKFKDFTIFFNAWQDLITDLPNHISCLLLIEQNSIVILLYAFNHQNLEISPESVNSFKRLLNSFSFPVLTKESTQLLSYPDFLIHDARSFSYALLTHPSQFANLTKHRFEGWKKAKSFYVDKYLSKDKISELNELLVDYVKDAGLLIEVCGGAINHFSSTESSFIHRNNLYSIQLYFPLAGSKESNMAADSALKIFYDESKAIFDHQESYQNYLDQDIPDALNRYYGTNLKKLIQIKSKIDPNNVFHHPQSIPVSLEVK